jgi:PAS domain S-box-containing protein
MPQDQKVFLPPGGTMGELIRSKDWSKTPLGPMEQWPKSLHIIVTFILDSPFPMIFGWGSQLTAIYNDAYLPLLGKKHPALGKPFLEVWHEAADIISPLVEQALTGESLSFHDAPFTLMRHGYPEQTWFDYSYSPLRDDDGAVAGFLNIAVETTERKQAEEALKKAKIQAERESARTRAILDSMAEGLVVADPNGNIIEMNPAGLSIHEFGSLDEVYRHLMEYPDLFDLHVEDGSLIPVEEWPMAKALRGEVFTGYELWVTRKDTGSKWIARYSGAPVRDGHGNIIMAVITLEDITERKHAEKTLSESEARYRELVQNANSAIIRWKADGTLTFFNEYAQTFFGYSADEVIGRHVGMLVPQEESTGADLSGLVRDIVANPEQYVNFVNENVRKDGSRAWMAWTNKPIFDTEGKVIEILAVGTEITDRKRAEDELRQISSELERRTRELGAILTSVKDYLYIFDSQGRFVFANEMLLNLWGLSKEQALGMTMRDLNYPEPVEEALSLAREHVFRTKQSTINETRYTSPTGISGIYENILAPILGTDGQVEYIVGSTRDITERKRTEEALRENEARYSSLFHNMTEEVHFWEIIRDKKGDISTWRLVDANLPTLKTWGKTLQEIKGKTTDEIFGPGATEHYLPVVRKIFAVKAPYSFEDYFPHLDKHFRFTSIPLENHFITTGADITAIKKVHENLERQVRERTSELEQANRAKDQFLANMSHEIRTPMSGVLGMTEILLHQGLPAKVQGDLAMVRRSAESVMTLINDLFDLSRISQGKFDFHPEVFDLRSMVRDAIGPFEFQASSKDLDFVLSIDESVPGQLLCDKDRLGQVIKNLISNAIKFTERGFIRVHVKAEKNDEDTLRLNFAVSDSGLGIPRKKQKDVFNAFIQLDPSYSKKFAGMGLGLAISKSLVEGMGGEILVESTKGKGATFRFNITCGIVTESQEPAAPSITLKDLPPMTILIAEDNAVNRLFLRRALITAGHKVGEAENGKHALEMIKDNHFDLVLMDIQMPEMDGVEAARRIRSGRHGRRDIPIIALTAYAMKGDREKFLSSGMNGYVTKPVDFNVLAGEIASVRGVSVPTSG